MLHTFNIITTEANTVVKPIHDRMPVILSPEVEELWLEEKVPQDKLASLLTPFMAEDMKAYPVSSLATE